MPGWLTWVRVSRRPSVRATRKTKTPAADIASVLEELDIRHFDEDILRMSLKKWEEYFSAKSSKRINIELVFRNVIWQAYEQIQAGNPPDFYNKRGFIRGLWYHIKAPLTRHKRFRKDMSGQVGRQLQLLVEKGLVSYTDFNFVDKDAVYKLIGVDNPHIIVFGEKEGFMSILSDIHETYGCTVIATGGQGSFLSINYMVARMVEAGIDLNQEFACVSLVDFDPVGWNIGEEFIKKLRNSGIQNFRRMEQYRGSYPDEKAKRLPYLWLDLIQPKNLPDSDREIARYTFKPKVQRSPSTLTWAKETGGVDGRGDPRHGISADQFTAERMHQLVGEALQPLIQTDPETARRRSGLRKLEDALKDFLLHKVLSQGSSETSPESGPGPTPDRPGRRKGRLPNRAHPGPPTRPETSRTAQGRGAEAGQDRRRRSSARAARR